MKPDSTFTQVIPEDYNVFAYVAGGEALFGEDRHLVKKEQMVFFEKNGDKINIDTSSDLIEPSEILIIGGSPIGDPIVRYGPFVMNTDEEIQQAIEDYSNGKMGKIDF